MEQLKKAKALYDYLMSNDLIQGYSAWEELPDDVQNIMLEAVKLAS